MPLFSVDTDDYIVLFIYYMIYNVRRDVNSVRKKQREKERHITERRREQVSFRGGKMKIENRSV